MAIEVYSRLLNRYPTISTFRRLGRPDLHLGLAFCLPGLCRSMAPLSPLPPFQLPLPLPLLLPLSPVPVRDRLPANVLVVLCACRSVGNKLPPSTADYIFVFCLPAQQRLRFLPVGPPDTRIAPVTAVYVPQRASSELVLRHPLWL